jgi:hypothetical protein
MQTDFHQYTALIVLHVIYDLQDPVRVLEVDRQPGNHSSNHCAENERDEDEEGNLAAKSFVSHINMWA